MNVLEAMDSVKKHVENYIDNNMEYVPMNVKSNPSSFNHMKDICVSIMNTKWGVGYPGGSFVQSLVENNLRETISRGDIVCRECIPFFVTMLYNISMPRSVHEYINL